MSPTHPQNDERITDYLDGRMTDSERVAFEEEMAQDESLREAVEQFEALSKAMSALPNEKPPADFSTKVMQSIEARPVATPASEVGRLPSAVKQRPKRAVFWAAAAVAAALLLMFWQPNAPEVAVAPDIATGERGSLGDEFDSVDSEMEASSVGATADESFNLADAPPKPLSKEEPGPLGGAALEGPSANSFYALDPSAPQEPKTSGNRVAEQDVQLDPTIRKRNFATRGRAQSTTAAPPTLPPAVPSQRAEASVAQDGPQIDAYAAPSLQQGVMREDAVTESVAPGPSHQPTASVIPPIGYHVLTVDCTAAEYVRLRKILDDDFDVDELKPRPAAPVSDDRREGGRATTLTDPWLFVSGRATEVQSRLKNAGFSIAEATESRRQLLSRWTLPEHAVPKSEGTDVDDELARRIVLSVRIVPAPASEIDGDPNP